MIKSLKQILTESEQADLILSVQVSTLPICGQIDAILHAMSTVAAEAVRKHGDMVAWVLFNATSQSGFF